MVEVFKTDVRDADQARLLVEVIQKNFDGYRANFDLEDCDRILRVAVSQGAVQVFPLVNFIKEFGYQAEVLADVVEGVVSVEWFVKQ